MALKRILLPVTVALSVICASFIIFWRISCTGGTGSSGCSLAEVVPESVEVRLGDCVRVMRFGREYRSVGPEERAHMSALVGQMIDAFRAGKSDEWQELFDTFSSCAREITQDAFNEIYAPMIAVLKEKLQERNVVCSGSKSSRLIREFDLVLRVVQSQAGLYVERDGYDYALVLVDRLAYGYFFAPDLCAGERPAEVDAVVIRFRNLFLEYVNSPICYTRLYMHRRALLGMMAPKGVKVDRGVVLRDVRRYAIGLESQGCMPSWIGEFEPNCP